MSHANSSKIVIHSLVAFGIRALIFSTGLSDWLSSRVEISTPINSWKRVVEGSYLLDIGISPYDGTNFHEDPINLSIYRMLIRLLGSNIDYLFAAVDVASAIILYYSSRNQMLVVKNNLKSDHSEVERSSFLIFLAQLYSPLTIATCCGRATTTFTNLLIILLSYSLTSSNLVKYIAILSAILAFQNVHLSTLAVASFLCYYSQQHNETNLKTSLHTYSTSFISTIAVLLGISYLIEGFSFKFIDATYLFSLTVPDYTPNIGMFWYFYTEMFDAFLPFFIWIMQINAFIHAVPLAISLRKDPIFAFYIILFSTSLFQPFQSLSNFSLIINMLPQWFHLFRFLKKSLIIVTALLITIALFPIFWHLWVMMQTANSNFYFGSTLAFTTAQILLLVDLIQAHRYLTAERMKTMEEIKNK